MSAVAHSLILMFTKKKATFDVLVFFGLEICIVRGITQRKKCTPTKPLNLIVKKVKFVGVSEETVYWNEIRWKMMKREQFNAII